MPKQLFTIGGWYLRALCNVGAFGLAVVLTCSAIGLFAPDLEVPSISEKLRFFQEHSSEYNAIFVGSSRVFHQIIPKQLDAAVQAGGYPLHSFNFGQDAMWPPESLYVVRQILRQPLPHLRWVFIELMDISTEMRGLAENDRTPQMVYWHDARHTWMAARSILSHSYPSSRKLELLSLHLRLWLQCEMHLGGGSTLLNRWQPPGGSKARFKPDWRAECGYSPLVRSPLTAKDRQEHLQRLAARKEHGPSPTSPLLLEELRKINALVREAGAEPIFFLSPSTFAAEDLFPRPEGVVTWPFNSLDRYPELQAPESFIDRGHLNVRGSMMYTDALAQAFLERVAQPSR